MTDPKTGHMISVRVPKETYDKLQLLRSVQSQPLSTLVRNLLNRGVAEALGDDSVQAMLRARLEAQQTLLNAYFTPANEDEAGA